MGQEKIATAIGTAREYLSAHPDEARYRDSPATAVVESGLRVTITGDDGASAVTDMVAGVGGDGSAPSPGWLFRAAYASCLATLIAMRAAESGVTLTRLEVRVDSESDDRGILGISAAIPAGPISAGIAVRAAASGIDEDVLREVIAWGVSHCPVDDAVRRAIPVELRVEID